MSPRAPYRPLLEDLARRQTSPSEFFELAEVVAAYAQQQDAPPRHRSANPWSFYAPEEIRKRQQRWAEEDAQADDGLRGGLDDEFDDEFEAGSYPLPYVREAPKVGRNDPCPCGSGRKYKKCCLDKPEMLPPAMGAPSAE